MKKKLLTILLTLIATLCLTLGLAACGGGNTGSGPDTEQDNTQKPDDGNDKDSDGGQTNNDKPLLPEEGYDENGLCFRLNDDGESYSVSQGEFEGASVVIPSIFNGAPVTLIGSSAFYGCSSLTSIVIPNSVTSIEVEAFYHCSSLTSITIPDSVTSIGREAFSDTAYYNDSSHWDASGVLYIGNHLIKAKKTIEGSYTIRDNTKTIASQAFWYCSSLESIEIPDSVTSIDSAAFYGCSGLTSITIPDSVTSIGSSAFNGCSGLTSITIPDSVTSIGSSAFSGTAYYNDQSHWDASGVLYIGNHLIEAKDTISGSYTIRANTKTIADYAFYFCRSLESLEIPNSMIKIGSRAFSRCSSLTNIEIPDSVTSIGDYAFYSCGSLESIEIPDSVTSIGDYAFNRIRDTAKNQKNLLKRSLSRA